MLSSAILPHGDLEDYKLRLRRAFPLQLRDSTVRNDMPYHDGRTPGIFTSLGGGRSIGTTLVTKSETRHTDHAFITATAGDIKPPLPSRIGSIELSLSYV